MLDLETDALTLHDADRVVLQAYLTAEQSFASQRAATAEAAAEAAADVDNEQTRWVARIREIEGVPQDCLAPSHGRLIALGHLQFQLQGRDAGVVYRITSTGRAVLAAAGDYATTAEPLRQSA